MRLNLGIRRRLAPLLDGDRRKIELLNSILFTLPGSPILYYGDEIGMGDNIWLEDRDGVRTPMQWEGGHNAGFSAAPPEKLYASPVDDEPFSYRRVNVAAQRADPDSLWNTLRRMIAVRRQEPALGCGECQFLPIENRAVLGLVRTCEGQSVLALHNMSAQPQTVELGSQGGQGAPAVRLLSSHARPDALDLSRALTLNPFEYLWLKVKVA